MDTLASIGWVHIAYALGLLIFGFLIAKHLSAITDRTLSKRISRHQAMLTRRLVFYGLLLIFLISALQQLGFNLTVLLGAAGIFTVALSFASQTAASNLISGIFLLFEQPFKVGDSIEVKNIKGIVDSIDLLSTKINTPDNTQIRVPNEVIMKSEITNLSCFKTRRLEIQIGVAYKTDIEHVKSVLLNLTYAHEGILNDPPAQVIISNFADSAIELKLLAWTKTDVVSSVKYQLHETIKQRFEQEGIEMPFPQITLHQG